MAPAAGTPARRGVARMPPRQCEGDGPAPKSGGARRPPPKAGSGERDEAPRPPQPSALDPRVPFDERTVHASAAPQEGAKVGGIAAELVARLRRLCARSRQVDVDHGFQPARGACQHGDAIGEQHGFGDAVGDEDDRLASAAVRQRRLPDAQQLVARASRVIRRGRRRVVHQQERGLKTSVRAKATRCCMPPESCRG